MSVYVGSPLPETPYEQTRRALADLSTPSGFVLGDVIARLVLDSGLVVPAAAASARQTDERGRTSACRPFCTGGLHESECPVVAPSDEGGEADLAEQGRRLASQRDDLIADGADPTDLVIPIFPSGHDTEQGGAK